MARQLFDIGIFSVLNLSGDIGSGWKLGFFTAGTTTEIITYNARTAGSANANPVVAAADGRFDEIWIDDNQTIKWVLSDANDVPKVTVDDFLITTQPPNITAALNNFLAGSSPLPIANGGSGQATAVNALAALGGFPLTGGTVTGDITRQAKGDYLYFNASALTNAEIFLTSSASPDPRSGLPGQIWMKHT